MKKAIAFGNWLSKNYQPYKKGYWRGKYFSVVWSTKTLYSNWRDEMKAKKSSK